MKKLIPLFLISCFLVSNIFAIENLNCKIRHKKDINIKKYPEIVAMCSLSIANNSYPDHFAFIIKSKNPDYAEDTYIMIFDYEEDSFAQRFEIMDIDNDGDDELIIWYMRGNHGHFMKVYEFENLDYSKKKPRAWATIFGGDSWDVEIKDGYIIEYVDNAEKGIKEVSGKYKIVKDGIFKSF